MANGPSTALFAAAIRTLLEGRNPSPLAPVPTGPMTPPGGFLPLPMGPAPEPAPIAPMRPRNQSLIEQLTGPRPVAPVEQPVSLLQKIALALQGFGAGVQGQGPQFLAGLREERERPMREFRAATEQFEDRRRRAIGFDEELRRREQQDVQRQADIQSGREFQLFELEQRDRMQEARDLRTQARQLEIEDRRAKAEERKQEAKAALDAKIAEAKAVKERQEEIRKQADVFMDDFRISRSQAIRFARHEVEGTPLTGADQKTYARIEKYRAPTGGGGSTGPVMAQLEDGTIVPLTAVNRDTGRVILDGKPLRVVGYVGGRVPARPQAAPASAPAATGDPLVNSLLSPNYTQSLLTPTAQPAAQATGDTMTAAELKEYMAQEGVSEQEARRRAKAAGITVK